MLDDKKAVSANARRFALHVALLMENEGLTKSKALALAYFEGGAGLDRRLGKPQLPFPPGPIEPVFAPVVGLGSTLGAPLDPSTGKK